MSASTSFLRALMADDVKLNQSSHPLRVGRADVGLFFTIYAKSDGVWLAPAWLESREAIAVFRRPGRSELWTTTLTMEMKV